MKGFTKGKKNKKKVAAVSLALALLAILAGTFAWSSYTEWVKNHMQSRGFDEGRVTIVEKFNPEPIDSAANGEIEKNVKVVNTSSTDSFVRISFEEMLHKLADGAEGKGWGSSDAAKFPVIINDAEYRSASYADLTSNLVIKDAAGNEIKASTLIAADETLKLYVTPDDSKAVMVIQKPMTKDEFPDDFDFKANNAAVPTISGSFAGGDAVVAQKVTGLVEKQPDGSYVVYTNKSANPDENLQIWGYGVDKGTAAEADWAGANVNVTATASSPSYDYGKSALDPQIVFTQANVVTDIPSAATPGKWYYDQASGYFYYLDVVKAGATTNSSVIEKLTFPNANTTDQTYKVASYNLYVGLEAIPASRSALLAGSGFGAFEGTPNKEGNKTWESNGFGWELTEDSDLHKFYKAIASVVE